MVAERWSWNECVIKRKKDRKSRGARCYLEPSLALFTEGPSGKGQRANTLLSPRWQYAITTATILNVTCSLSLTPDHCLSAGIDFMKCGNYTTHWLRDLRVCGCWFKSRTKKESGGREVNECTAKISLCKNYVQNGHSAPRGLCPIPPFTIQCRK